MQWYDNGKFYISGDKAMTAARGHVKKVEYAEIEHVTAFAARLEDLEVREGKIAKQVSENRQNIEDAFDQIRFNYNALQNLSRRVTHLEDAPSVAKRKCRVTICAGDQKVEVIKL